MGILVILGGFGFLFSLIFCIYSTVEDVKFHLSSFVMTIMFAGLVFFGVLMENRAKNNLEITTIEYKAFRIEEINLDSERPMLIRETCYNYPRYSIFFDDKKEYEILSLEE